MALSAEKVCVNQIVYITLFRALSIAILLFNP